MVKKTEGILGVKEVVAGPFTFCSCLARRAYFLDYVIECI
jgi:hypothetical protein